MEKHEARMWRLAKMIEGVRVEQVREAREVAVAGRHDGHEETWTS